MSARFMAVAFHTKPETYDRIAAGTHPYDRTVRPQYVYAESNPGYHALISAFEKKTGTPALLNTSFNLHGQPIVNTIDDALLTFAKSGLDHLLIGETMLSKKNEL